MVEATVDSLPLKVREEQRAAEHALEERLKVHRKNTGQAGEMQGEGCALLCGQTCHREVWRAKVLRQSMAMAETRRRYRVLLHHTFKLTTLVVGGRKPEKKGARLEIRL